MRLYPDLTGLSNGQSCCGSDEIWEHYACNLDLYTSAQNFIQPSFDFIYTEKPIFVAFI